jgi:magnesium transporter
MRCIYYAGEGESVVSVPPERVLEVVQAKKGLLWLDLDGDTHEESEVLLNGFGFHPLAVDDALHESHVPKIDDYQEYVYIVLHAIDFEPQGSEVNTLELDMFLGRTYLVTHHTEVIPALDSVWKLAQRGERHVVRGADFLLYELADRLITDFMPVVDELDDAIDRVEEEVFGDPTPRVLNRIFDLKRAVLHLRRTIAPSREVLNRLARDDYDVIDARDRIYFRDVYDHLVRLYDINEALRDLVSGALDTYLSVASNRINEIVKVLTVVTVALMPPTLVASFYGMNFPNLPFLNEPWGWVFALVLIIASFVGPLLYLRQRGWW